MTIITPEFRLSVSKSKTFKDCSAKYNFNYNLKLEKKQWAHFSFGSCAHKILEDFHNHYIQNPNEERDVGKIMTICYRAGIEEFKEKLTDEQIAEIKVIIGQYVSLMRKGKPNVIGCEKRFDVKLNEYISFNGSIDMIKIDPDGMLHICDYKTTKDKKYMDDYFQLLAYAYILHRENPFDKVRCSFIMLKHNFDYLTKEFTPKDFEYIPGYLIKCVKDIEKETEWKGNPSFLCSYCDYADKCQHFAEYNKKPEPDMETGW